ncbi:MAG: enoyl-CoA hydratase [Ectothiorhodospiraceae bacterium]|nr:enoyl-CoA hydratase [Ectothiorhodospiraceae bacterium]
MSSTASSAAGAEIRLQQEGGIARVTLPGADRYNPLTGAVIDSLHALLDGLAEDNTVRVVIIDAEGKAFCAGHDLKEIRASEDPDYHRDLFSRCSALMQRIVTLPQPVIAQVQGIATAAGCQLVATCDLAVAGESARFATSGINLGLFCATPAVAVTRNVAAKHAAHLLFTGEFIDAARAEAVGLVNQVVADQALRQATQQLAETIAAKPAVSIRAGKQLLKRQMECGLGEAYALATETMACNMETEAAREGIDAFIEKRKPRWT